MDLGLFVLGLLLMLGGAVAVYDYDSPRLGGVASAVGMTAMWYSAMHAFGFGFMWPATLPLAVLFYSFTRKIDDEHSVPDAKETKT